MLPPLSLLALWLATASSPVLAATAGSFVESGETLVSAMMVSKPINPLNLCLSASRCSSVTKKKYTYWTRRRVMLHKSLATQHGVQFGGYKLCWIDIFPY
jgi:hypothetical protein